MISKEDTSNFIHKLQDGDEGAWEQFDAQYRQRIINYLLKMGLNAFDAEDIYHETLVKVLQRIDEFDEKRYFDRWLHRIAINQCIDYLRRRRRSPLSAWSEDTFEIADRDLEPSLKAQQNELRQKIDEAIASLPNRQRQIAQLRLLKEMKFGEIADEIGGNSASLKAMFGKAKKKLQLQLAAYLQAFWAPWHRLKEFALGSVASKGVTLPIALAVSLSFHSMLIYSLRHLPQNPENMFTSTSAIGVTLADSLSMGRGRQVRHPPAISVLGQKNRADLSTGIINLKANSTESSGKTLGEGFASTLFIPPQPVAVPFPEIQVQSSEATEFPDVWGTQVSPIAYSYPNSTQRQGIALKRNQNVSFLPISQKTLFGDSVHAAPSVSPAFFYREAEHPDEIKGFKIEQNPKAFNGEYLVLPKDVPLNNATASYQFTVTEAQAGDYYLWGRVLSKNLQSDSFFVKMDSSIPRYIWDTGVFQQWTWTISVKIGNETPQKIHLAVGEHTLSILARETDTQLDALLLSRIVPTKSAEVTHALPRQPLSEEWVDGNANEFIPFTETAEVFTSYIRFGNVFKDTSSTLINWPLRRLRFSGQPLDLALGTPYQTHLFSEKPSKQQLWLHYSQIRPNPTIFCLSFGNRCKIVVASPVVFLSNESGLLAVMGAVSALGNGFTLSQQRQLYRTLTNGGGRLILLANKQSWFRFRREMAEIFPRYEWQELPRPHQLFSYPVELPESISVKGMDLPPVNKEDKDKIRREWRVLLVEIEEEKVVPQFLWNLSYFDEGKY